MATTCAPGHSDGIAGREVRRTLTGGTCALASIALLGAMTACGAGPTGVATGGSSAQATPSPAVTPQSPDPFGVGGVSSPGPGGSAPPVPSAAPGTVTKMFTLTVNGTVPATDRFTLTFDSGTGPQTVTLCTGDVTEGVPQCMGNGEAITKSFANLTPSTTSAPFAFQHVNAHVADTFYTATTSMAVSTTVTAFYNE